MIFNNLLGVRFVFALGAASLLLVAVGCKTDVGRAIDQVEDYVDSCEELTESLDEVEGPESAAEAVKRVDEHIARVKEINEESAEINPSPEQIQQISDEVDEMDIDGVHERLLSAAVGALNRTNNDPELNSAMQRLMGTGFHFRGTDRVSD